VNFTVLTLFPDLIDAWKGTGLVGSAIKKNLLRVDTLNPRNFTSDNHKSVDDSAFGGSDGMVMMFEPMAKAIESVESAHVVFLTPQGAQWNQSRALRWQQQNKNVLLVCGRYAGFDQRLIETYADEEISVGDYILNGGEVASLAVMESVSRLIPGVLGNDKSSVNESFSDGLLEAPAFTRPREIAGMPVPAPLLSGNHAEIARFEHDISLLRTKLLRPDLFEKTNLKNEWRASFSRIRKLSRAELNSLGITVEQLAHLESQTP
jgi:tRNA (guanine37-N1)-methyltransferase